jgi:hypothetical protein
MKNLKLFIDEADAIELIKNLINNETEFRKILVDEKGQCKKYSTSEEDAKLFSNITPTSYCPDEELTKNLIKIIMNENINKIANWLLSTNPVLKIKYNSESIIGYKINFPEDNKRPLNNALLTIRKDVDYKTEHGFYVAGIIPIDSAS